MGRDRDRRLYRFEPLDTSGVFLGLGPVQAALLGGGLVVSVLALSAGLPLLLAALPVVGGAAGSFARVGGRAAWEWIPLAAAWLTARVGRGSHWYAPLPLVDGSGVGEVAMPPCLEGVSVAAIPRSGRPAIGAVHDVQRGTLTALVRVVGPQFSVADVAEQERLLDGWADALNAFAVERSAVTHLGWSDLARPSGMAEQLAWMQRRSPDGVDVEAAASYEELVGDASSRATEHDVVVTVTVAEDRLPRRNGQPTNERVGEALTGAVDALIRAVGSAGLEPGPALSPLEIRRLVRTRIDPHHTRPHLTAGRLTDRLAVVGEASAGPLVVESAWGHVRVDGVFHRTFWIATWPRLAVPPSWLEPFLAGAPGVTRTVTVTFTPVPAHRSKRRIERGLVKLESDASTKQSKGRRVDARHERAIQTLLEREQELVAGYTEMAYAGLLTVTAATLEALDADSEVVEQTAREAGLELRSLDGRHDLAWAAALPIGLTPRMTVT